MDIFTGMDYRNGHYAVALGALNVFYLHKMYFWSHINSLNKINFILVLQNRLPRMVRGWGHCSKVSMIKIYYIEITS